MAAPWIGTDDPMGRYPLPVLSVFLVNAAAGTVLGFLSGLGIGGGSLLILWLTLIQGMSQETARCFNLLFFIPSAVIACLFRRKQGTLDFKEIFPGILAGCIGAAIFSYIGLNLETNLLKKGFGILLLLTGLREIRYKPKS